MTNDSHYILGIYGIPEAARLLATTPPLANGHVVDPTRLRYWIRTGVSPITPVVLPTRQRLIGFRDLISMRLIAILRSRNINLQAIRITEEWVRQSLQTDWPFVSRPIWTYGSDVFIEFEERLISVSRFGQQAMAFLREWLTKVELDMTFDEKELASSWKPYPDVKLDPKVQFGEPCVAGTRIPTSTIGGKVLAGDRIEVIARLYGLTIPQIQHALEWEQRIAAA
jgi:uncharacterized protein (DUF433 family)